jgi:hypothetical protein
MNPRTTSRRVAGVVCGLSAEPVRAILSRTWLQPCLAEISVHCNLLSLPALLANRLGNACPWKLPAAACRLETVGCTASAGCSQA